ncbi:phosphoribosyltransferase [Candidatus Saccharibacteria bacterium]|nr:MAG: phosphoribosyltransferase [Candidatus Saccharibacteria bacterium]
MSESAVAMPEVTSGLSITSGPMQGLLERLLAVPQRSSNDEFGQQEFVGSLALSATKPEHLPAMALPVLEFMEDVKPHIVIACDRGGRLFGLAVHAAWQRTRGGQPFPTLDGKLHFARISKTEDYDVLQAKIDIIIEASRRFGQQHGNEPADNEQLRVLFVDDWVTGGGTKQLAQLLMEKHSAQTYYGVMHGEDADVTGKREPDKNVSWRDRPEESGINYLSAIWEKPDGTIAQTLTAVAVPGVKARHNRWLIQEAARRLPTALVLGAAICYPTSTSR